MKRMSLDEYQAALQGQGVSSREHAAVVCCVCATVQSVALFKAVGDLGEEDIEARIGHACVGIAAGSGAWDKRREDAGDREAIERGRTGCDWHLGGLFRLHECEIVMPDGRKVPAFRPATQDEARDLELRLRAEAMAARLKA